MGVISNIDNHLALAHKKIFPVKNSLISILIHCLFKDSEEIKKSNADPQQSITIEDLDKIISFYLNKGYIFLTQDELATGNFDSNEKYCFLTFDDGYYNNLRAVELLEKYKVPATFYCSTFQICEQKSFWWDVYYRERTKEGASIYEIREEKKELKKLKHEQIITFLTQKFGEKSLEPVDHTDRPFTVEELIEFSKNPFVCIGNHTHKHLILTNYSKEEIIEDIEINQKTLTDLIGKKPTTIAYPNGNIRSELIPELKKIGLKAGITTLRGKNLLPFNIHRDNAFHIKRYTPWHHNLLSMLELSETDFHFKNLFKS